MNAPLPAAATAPALMSGDDYRESLRRLKPVVWLDGRAQMSVWTTTINIMEIRFGFSIMPSGRRRDRQVLEFERLIGDDLQGRILSFDVEAAEQAGALMAARRLAGRPGELRDTMIAGIVLAQRATLATRNVRHFDDLNVPVVNPWRA